MTVTVPSMKELVEDLYNNAILKYVSDDGEEEKTVVAIYDVSYLKARLQMIADICGFDIESGNDVESSANSDVVE